MSIYFKTPVMLLFSYHWQCDRRWTAGRREHDTDRSTNNESFTAFINWASINWRLVSLWQSHCVFFILLPKDYCFRHRSKMVRITLCVSSNTRLDTPDICALLTCLQIIRPTVLFTSPNISMLADCNRSSLSRWSASSSWSGCMLFVDDQSTDSSCSQSNVVVFRLTERTCVPCTLWICIACGAQCASATYEPPHSSRFIEALDRMIDSTDMSISYAIQTFFKLLTVLMKWTTVVQYIRHVQLYTLPSLTKWLCDRIVTRSERKQTSSHCNWTCMLNTQLHTIIQL